MNRMGLTGLARLAMVLSAAGVWAGEPVTIDTCPGGAAISQAPGEAQDTPGYSGDGDGLRAYDDFTGAPGPISSIVWWGGGVAGGECTHDGDFEISFYSNLGGQPDELVTTRTISPTFTSTGETGTLGTIYRYEATLDPPVPVASGWLSVYAVDFDGCYFYWANSAAGNNNAYTNGGGNTGTDFAFCLGTEGSFAGLDCTGDAAVSQGAGDSASSPGFSDEGDSLRAYDNFSGVADPIARVVWWGGGTNISGGCERAPNFELAFYEDDGAQPGTLVSAQTVTAIAVATGQSTTLGSLYRYEAMLPMPVDLAAGWLRVLAVNFSGCYFYWMNSEDGDNFAVTTNGTTAADYAFCLYTEDGFHTADQGGDGVVNLSELLRVIQFYNSDGFGCEDETEDGYAPNDSDTDCGPHDSDYNPQDWEITLTELLRLIQFYNSGSYQYCPDANPATEDGFCPGAP